MKIKLFFLNFRTGISFITTQLSSHLAFPKRLESGLNVTWRRLKTTRDAL